MSEGARYIFANAMAAITLRADGEADFLAHKRNFCRAIAIGFGKTATDGDNAFTFASTSLTSTVLGFESDSPYASFEDAIRAYIDADSATSTLSLNDRRRLAASVNAVLFGFSLSPNITYTELVSIVGNVLVATGNRVVGEQRYEFTRDGEVIHPFSRTVIQALFAANNYTTVAATVKSSPKNVEVDLVHYNYYDMRDVFKNPDPDRLKDSENQYYYFSGAFIYPDVPASGLDFCEQKTMTITTVNGPKEITILTNYPCVYEDSFTAPLTGTKFYRVFQDGPFSSGDFTKSVKNQYQAWDRARLSGVDYSGNLTRLFSFQHEGTGTGYYLIYDGVQKDVEGLYSLSHEYSNAPISSSECGPHQVMRIGDARLRSQCVTYDQGKCIECKEVSLTGFKYASLELEESLWTIGLPTR
jgi:hypothetical protein